MSDNINRAAGRRPNPLAARMRESDIREDDVRMTGTHKVATDRMGRPVVRKRLSSMDRYYVNPDRIEKGWSYEWKRWSVFNQEDPSYMISLQENGWTPVPAERHPELVPNGVGGDSAIIRDGMILMERPAILTEEAKQEDIDIARGMIREKQRQLGEAPNGTLPRDVHRDTAPRLKRGYEAIPVPDDADQPLDQ